MPDPRNPLTHASETWKILVIDDEPDVRDIMAISLEDAGYEVFCAPDGETGLAMLTARSPQILITDIKMPGMSGLEVLEKAGQLRPDTQVIVTTGFADIKKAVTALQHDASDFITKPVDDTTLHLALKRAMQRYRDRKELADYTRLLEQTVLNQEKILHQEKMMSLGRLAASIVHEINNPLSGILNYIRLMIRLTEKPEWDERSRDRFKNYLTVILQETRRCADLVSGLLQFSRKSSPQFSRVNICELMDYSLKLCNHKLALADILVKTACPPDLPEVSGDFNQLQQCLINLIFNSIDAMETTGSGMADMPGPEVGDTPAGRTGVFDTRSGPDHPGSRTSGTGISSGIPDGASPRNTPVGSHSGTILDRTPGSNRFWIRLDGYFETPENRVCLRVSDNGKGISAQDLPRIFEPFFTTKNEGHGVGLGLSTVYGIIDHHKGTIAVESEPGRGTDVIIKLPPADGAVPGVTTGDSDDVCRSDEAGQVNQKTKNKQQVKAMPDPAALNQVKPEDMKPEGIKPDDTNPAKPGPDHTEERTHESG
jgi:signal transduction histidine kinase